MKQTICVDVDGVLATDDGWQGVDHFGDPIDGAIEFTKRLSEYFHICIFTCRCYGDINKPEKPHLLVNRVRNWLDEHGVAYDEIYAGVGKPIALAYIDDRGINCQPGKHGKKVFDDIINLLIKEEKTKEIEELSDIDKKLAE